MGLLFRRSILLAWAGVTACVVGAALSGEAWARLVADGLCLGLVVLIFLESRPLFSWSEEVPVTRRLAALAQIALWMIPVGLAFSALFLAHEGVPPFSRPLSPWVFRAAAGFLQSVLAFLLGGAAVFLASLVFHRAGTLRRIVDAVLLAALVVSAIALPPSRGWPLMLFLGLGLSLAMPWARELTGRARAAVFFGAILVPILLALYNSNIVWATAETRLGTVLRDEVSLGLAAFLRAVLALWSGHVLVFAVRTAFAPTGRLARVRGGLRTKLGLFYLLAGAVPLILMVLVLSVGFYIVLGGSMASVAKKMALERADACRQWGETAIGDPDVLRWAREVDILPGGVTEDPGPVEVLEDFDAERGRLGETGYLLVQAGVDSSRVIAHSRAIPDDRAGGYLPPAWALDGGHAGLVSVPDGVWGRAISGRRLGDRWVTVETGARVDQPFLEKMKTLTASDFELSNGYWLQVTVARRQVSAARDTVPDAAPREWRTLSTMAPDSLARPGLLDRRLYFGGAFLPEMDGETGLVGERVAGMLLVRTSLRNLYQVLFAPENTINVLLLVLVGILAGLFLVIILLASGVGLRILHSITRSVDTLKKGTQHVKAGDFDYRLRVPSHDEFQDLAESFNTMSAEVRRMLAAVEAKEKLEAELRIARNIQQRLLPQATPETRGYEIRGRSTPAREVGGDYYDYLVFEDGSLGLAIADVAGKGITAALLMANLQASLRALAREPTGIGPLAGELNHQLLRTTSPEMYATFFYGILDTKTGIFSYCNCGHNPPLLAHADGSVEWLDVGGFPLGMIEGSTYDEGAVALRAEDLLVLYTDGVPDAENIGGDHLGETRLQDIVVASRRETASVVQERIHRAVEEFSAGRDPSDDFTVVTLKVLPEAGL
jgi:serine phosphatase RsbU (regulator of sigma subunit)